MCNTDYGLLGSDCHQWCQQAVGILLVNVTTGIFGVVMAIISIYLLTGIIRRKKHRNINPVLVTLVFSSVAFVFYVVASILSMLSTLAFPYLYTIILTSGGRLIKRTPQQLQSATMVLFAIANCFSICSVVMLPLTWVSILTLD